MEQKVYFRNGKGQKLCGILSELVGGKKKIVIVMVHGYGSNKNTMSLSAISETLANNGIPTLRFDMAGFGESEGKLEYVTPQSSFDDVLSACVFVKGKGYENIGMVGSSFGGVAALHAASKDPGIIFLVLMSMGYGERIVSIESFSKEQDKVFGEAGKVKAATYAIFGGNDEVVRTDKSIEAVKRIKNHTIDIIEGADHSFKKSQEVFDKRLKLVTGFIFEHCGCV